MPKKSVETTAPFLARLDVAQVTFNIVGISPLVMHRQSEKAQHELLQASVKKNKADRSAEAKHDPVNEFRAAIYRNRQDDTPTVCHMPGGAFKRAMAEAALRIPGGNKTETGSSFTSSTKPFSSLAYRSCFRNGCVKAWPKPRT
jgi:hypothetical protein